MVTPNGHHCDDPQGGTLRPVCFQSVLYGTLSDEPTSPFPLQNLEIITLTTAKIHGYTVSNYRRAVDDDPLVYDPPVMMPRGHGAMGFLNPRASFFTG